MAEKKTWAELLEGRRKPVHKPLVQKDAERKDNSMFIDMKGRPNADYYEGKEAEKYAREQEENYSSMTPEEKHEYKDWKVDNHNLRWKNLMSNDPKKLIY